MQIGNRWKGALMVALVLVLAAQPAAALPPRPATVLSRALDWLSFWWNAALPQGGGLDHVWGRQGLGADPNGGASATGTYASGAGGRGFTSLQGAQGLGADPDGSHLATAPPAAGGLAVVQGDQGLGADPNGSH